LFKNRISKAGVLAICEFIRANKRAAAVHEMHLSHNEIDDESAHELLRTLQEQRPRYPPRRPVEGAEEGTTALVPVWVRLNHNRIRDPSTVLRAFEVEGITFCAARMPIVVVLESALSLSARLRTCTSLLTRHRADGSATVVTPSEMAHPEEHL